MMHSTLNLSPLLDLRNTMHSQRPGRNQQHGMTPRAQPSSSFNQGASPTAARAGSVLPPLRNARPSPIRTNLRGKRNSTIDQQSAVRRKQSNIGFGQPNTSQPRKGLFRDQRRSEFEAIQNSALIRQTGLNWPQSSMREESEIQSPISRRILQVKDSSMTAGLDQSSVTTTGRGNHLSPLRKAPGQKLTHLPEVKNSGAAYRSKNLYNQNFTLDIDSYVYSSRQSVPRVGLFYDQIVKKSILQTTEPTPLLSPERLAITKKKIFGGRVGSQVTTANKVDLYLNDRLMAAESQLDREMGHDLSMPNLANVLSQDKLRGATQNKHAISVAELTKMSAEPSTVTDNRQTAVETHPQTTSAPLHSYQDYSIQQLTRENNSLRDDDLMDENAGQSILLQSEKFDPRAGNSIVRHLNMSVREDVEQQLDKLVHENERARSKQRRRMNLGGEHVINKYEPDAYEQKGILQELEGEANSASDGTLTESLANSSIYNALMDDIEAVKLYINDAEQEEEEKKQQRGNPPTITRRFTRSNLPTIAEKRTAHLKERKQKEEEEEMRLDPDAHFRKLKAKIKLKVTKTYEEDEQRKKKAAEDEINKPKAVIKDKYGRVMQKVAPKMSRMSLQRIPSMNRVPTKIQPPKRLRSFTEAQQKYYAAEDIYNPLHKYTQPLLTNQYVINVMKEMGRFPIPEALVSRPKHKPYTLRIDSIISATFTMEALKEWADYRPELDAPYGSMESEEEFQLYDSQDSEEEQTYPAIPKAKIKENPELAKKLFDKALLDNNPFRIDSMKYFPYRTRDSDVPVKLLRLPKLQVLWDSREAIKKEQTTDKWTQELAQNVFEHFCMEMKAAAIKLDQFYNFDDPRNKKISIKNHSLDDQTVKALCMTLPHLTDFNEIELFNNHITDAVSPALVLAVFANPSIRRVTIAYNFMQLGLTRALAIMAQEDPEKVTELNLMGSITFADHIEPIMREMPNLKKLSLLNIAGCNLTQAACRDIARFMQTSVSLRSLDVSHCKINFQGSRYLVDALNFNSYLNSFNFSHNDLNSEKYEFGIKMASIVTRHPCLMHLDITNTNLKREEIMFIGLSLSTSKTMLSLHLTAQKLPYYERIFLRAAIAARVGYQYRSSTQRRKVNSNKEKNQILQIAGGEVQQSLTARYMDNLRELDQRREGLDFEIQDLLSEIDTAASFADLNQDLKVEDLPKDSKVANLIQKLVDRQKEIDAQREAIQEIISEAPSEVLEGVKALAGAKDLGKQMHAMFGQPEKQQDLRQPEQEKDIFGEMNELRVERQRAKAEMEVVKENKDRSAGELALMFMGINQVAYDLLVENPMTGYMNEIIFSRVLGHDEIEQGTYWMDSVNCWVCNKWNKVVITYHKENDRKIFTQKVNKLETIQQRISRVIQERVEEARAQKKQLELEDQIEAVMVDEKDSFFDDAPGEETTPMLGSSNRLHHESIGNIDSDARQLSAQVVQGVTANTNTSTKKIGSGKEVNDASSRAFQSPTMLEIPSPDRTSVDRSNQVRSSVGQVAEDEPPETIHEAPLEDEQELIDEANIGLQIVKQEQELEQVKPRVVDGKDTTNTMAPITTDVNMVKGLVFPKDYETVNRIAYKMPTAEEIYGDELQRLNSLNLYARKHLVKAQSISNNNVTVTPIYRRTTDPMLARMGSLRLHAQAQVDAIAQARQKVESKDGTSSHTGTGVHSSVISHSEMKRRQRGEPVIIQRQIFFDGVVYQIEEELYSDSDHSSVYTSEDEFEQVKHLQERFKRENPLVKDQSKEETDSSQSGIPIIDVDEFQSHNLDDKSDLVKKSDPGLGRAMQVPTPLDSNNPDDKTQKPVSELGQLQVPQQDDEASEAIPKKKANSIIMNARNLLQQEYYTNSKNLVQEQLDYEVKLVTKKYRPDDMNKRVHYFESNIPRIMNQKKTDFERETYLVASFNDWIPMRMKTMRRLLLERYPTDYPVEEIPKQIYAADNSMHNFAQMVPAGVHFFYFVEDRGEIFLSPRFEVIRFKNTNIFLNKVKVMKRLEDIETVHHSKEGDEDEAVFMKDRSVFREYREDTEAFLQKCFEEDIQFSKIKKTINKKSDVEAEYTAIQEVLLREYQSIINIFNYYSGTSSYPTIGYNDVTEFGRQTRIVDGKIIGLAALDLLLVATCVSNNDFILSAEKDLQRYEFLEFIVRVGIFRYKEQGICKTTVQAIELVLEELIYPHAKNMDGANFRRYFCYNVKTNTILQKNDELLRKVYKSFTNAKKWWVNLAECKQYVQDIGFLGKVSLMMVGAIFAECMMTMIDTIRDQSKPNQMRYVEFTVFICRIAHEYYVGTPYEHELLYKKLDHLMPAFLSKHNLQPNFLFGEKFAIDEEKERLRNKRKKRRLFDQVKNQRAFGKPVDSFLLKEVKAYEDQHLQDGRGSFHASQLELADFSSDSGSHMHVSSDEGKSAINRTHAVAAHATASKPGSVKSGRQLSDITAKKSRIDKSPKGTVQHDIKDDQSLGFVSQIDSGKKPEINVDLQEVAAVNKSMEITLGTQEIMMGVKDPAVASDHDPMNQTGSLIANYDQENN